MSGDFWLNEDSFLFKPAAKDCSSRSSSDVFLVAPLERPLSSA